MNEPFAPSYDRTRRKCPCWLWLATIVLVLIGLVTAAVFIPEAYNDASDRKLCIKQMSQLDDAFRTIAILGSAGIGVSAAVFLALWCFDSARLGRMLLNLEATALLMLVLVWAVVFVAGTFASHCQTAHQAEIWTACVALTVAVLLWMCCRQQNQ